MHPILQEAYTVSSMSKLGNEVIVLSANCQGIRNTQKRQDVVNYLRDTKAGIICLQDTHLLEKDIRDLKKIWNDDIFLNGKRSNSRGVAILIRKNFEYEVLEQNKDNEGNYLQLILRINSVTLNLITVYAPNNDSPQFFNDIQKMIEDSDTNYIIVCGDFNLVMDPDKDCSNYKNLNNPKARLVVKNIMAEYDLVDAYRNIHPDKKRYSWRRKNPVKQARLDYFLISNSMLEIIENCDIKPSYRSDHSIIQLNIIQNMFTIGKGVWKFNNSLLSNHEYINLINTVISEEKIKYAVPVYNHNYLENPDNTNISLRIDYDTFLELLYLRIRGETIKFSSKLKRLSSDKETVLKRDIEKLEASEIPAPHVTQILIDKKQELEELRKTTIKGHMIRARIKWITEGEKPTKYFCNLEKQKFIEKTIKKVHSADGNIITDQTEILQQIRIYYTNLFKNRDTSLEDIDLTDILKDIELKKLENIELGNDITVEEAGQALKLMKNNKTPGLDGISVEFIKVFWRMLKVFITNAINSCFHKGILSQTLRQSIITCLPKGTKDRQYLKNWRPISILCVTYKLASSVIANRIKPYLSDIISSTQTGFIAGRYMGDSTRLIYDIIHYAESKDLTNLLMLIDFEKAFDSISWKFLYNTLNFFGFSKNLIRWIKLFNNDVIARVQQCGILSDPIQIGRGCKQGDPISPYLFIIAAEILSLLIKMNPSIVGININKTEFKLTQFADDTTIILDGSVRSLQATLNVLEVYGTWSGLKMNTDKTKLIWIGRKRFSKRKIECIHKIRLE